MLAYKLTGSHCCAHPSTAPDKAEVSWEAHENKTSWHAQLKRGVVLRESTSMHAREYIMLQDLEYLEQCAHKSLQEVTGGSKPGNPSKTKKYQKQKTQWKKMDWHTAFTRPGGTLNKEQVEVIRPGPTDLQIPSLMGFNLVCWPFGCHEWLHLKHFWMSKLTWNNKTCSQRGKLLLTLRSDLWLADVQSVNLFKVKAGFRHRVSSWCLVVEETWDVTQHKSKSSRSSYLCCVKHVPITSLSTSLLVCNSVICHVRRGVTWFMDGDSRRG